MRELKFRVYDKDLAKYLEGCGIDSLMADLCSEGDGRAVIIKQICPARYIFEQYTGLKDKDDREIYEGDIVRWTDNYDENGYIDFGDGCFLVNWSINSERINVDMVDDLEVIGNIHENADLLEELK